MTNFLADIDDETEEKQGAFQDRTGRLDAETKHARELFLFGNGDGKRIKNVKKLAEMSGCGERTIYRHMEQWQRESESLALATTGKSGAVVLRITEKELLFSAQHVSILQRQLEKIAKVIDEATPGSDWHMELVKLHAATLLKWQAASGFADHADTQATFAKEMARQAARLAGKSADSEPEERPAKGFAFDISTGE
jgi:uncharacterized protein with von Willebrand factor type A (vWA) domain